MTQRGLPIVDRFMSKVDIGEGDECWIWMPGPANRSGHGQMSVNNRMTLAHRIAYVLFVGPIPEGQVVRHWCHVPLCVSPDHLIAGTVAQNNADTARWRLAARRLIAAHSSEFRALLAEAMEPVSRVQECRNLAPNRIAA